MLAARVRPRCQAFMNRLFLHRPAIAPRSAQLEAVVQRFGIGDVRVVKTRADTKVIARGTHPEWGAVAVKVIDPVASPGMAHQGLHADGIVAENPSSILPRIHAYGLGYSVSEWIQGEEARKVEPGVFRTMPLVPLVDDIAAWCNRLGNGVPLGEAAVLSILRFYVGVTVRRMLYRGAATCVAACFRFSADRKRLAGYLDNMAALAPRLRLRSTPMLSDLNPINVIFDPARKRLVYIDLEPLRPGSYAFDAVFFVSFLMAMRSPTEATDALARHVLSESYLKCPVAVSFFRDFASYVVSAYMTIDGHDRHAIEANLKTIRRLAG